MTKINKITTLREPISLTDEQIQVHFDVQNAEGWTLIGVDNLVGWYRFFWVKEIE
jgi:hypothetical protein